MADALRRCRDCQADITHRHFNVRYCAACQASRNRNPRSNLTPAQQHQIARLAGTMPRKDIARQVGTSHASVNRYLREQQLRSNSQAYPADLVDAVCMAYERGGKPLVRQLFPDVVVRSIVERFPHAPRQTRWTGEQLIEAARMAGLVSHNAQARWLGRPNAYAGSIKSLWAKGFHCAPRDVHGLGAHLVWQLCTPGVIATLVHQQTLPGPHTVVLWLDLAGHLRGDVAPEVREAIEALAQFQRWLFQGKTSNDIRAFITERETTYGPADRDHTQWSDHAPHEARARECL